MYNESIVKYNSDAQQELVSLPVITVRELIINGKGVLMANNTGNIAVSLNMIDEAGNTFISHVVYPGIDNIIARE